jgi:hypothetical protein
MQDFLKRSSGARIGKNNLCQSGAVKNTGRGQNPFAEARCNLPERCCPREDGIPCQLIRIYHRDTVTGQQPGDRALARGNPSCQPDHPHVKPAACRHRE